MTPLHLAIPAFILGTAMLQWWDAFKARHTIVVTDSWGLPEPKRWYAWYQVRDGIMDVDVFILHVPVIRSWQRTSGVADFRCCWREGWHRLRLMHTLVRSAGIEVKREWSHQWIPTADCPDIPYTLE